jgi:predicted HicB family RNase H-like nuclease
MTDPDRYGITVRKVRVDGEDLWRATVRELPDVAEFAATREEAVELARDAIEDLQASALEDGTPFPEPIEEEDEYSGRVTLRMSRSLHREVAGRADREGVSLNSYLVECIALRPSQYVSVAGTFQDRGLHSWTSNDPIQYVTGQSVLGSLAAFNMKSVVGGSFDVIISDPQFAISTATPFAWEEKPRAVLPLLLRKTA